MIDWYAIPTLASTKGTVVGIVFVFSSCDKTNVSIGVVDVCEAGREAIVTELGACSGCAGGGVFMTGITCKSWAVVTAMGCSSLDAIGGGEVISGS